MFKPLLIALQFLTLVPIRIKDSPDAATVGRSLLYYPLVGLLIGVLLAALGRTLGDAPPMLSAAILLTVWVAVTGALHLDGLADSADAWVGGHGSRDRTLAIMKDPCSGPMGVTAVTLTLLMKFSALVALCEAEEFLFILLAPCLGRVVLPLLFLTTRYVRHGGLATVLAAHFPRPLARWVVVGSCVCVLLVHSTGWFILLIGGFGFLAVRAAMIRRLGGTTGDTAGALVEIIETFALVTAAVVGSA